MTRHTARMRQIERLEQADIAEANAALYAKECQQVRDYLKKKNKIGVRKAQRESK